MHRLKTKALFSPLYLWRGVVGKGFTLVELIVVIVILSILSTIAFLSFSSYSSSSRDSVRLGDITNIAKGLTLQYSIGGSYIIPDNSVSLLSGSTTIIGYQGKAGYNTLNSIKLSTSNNNSGKDPLDNTYYTYNINSNKNKYQLSGFLENKGTIINRTSSINNREGNNDLIPHLTPAYRQAGPSRLGEELSSLPLTKGELEGVFQINQVNATTYTNRYPYTKGDSIGVILNYTGTTTGNNNTTNTIYTPIEDNISTSTGIDISSGSLTSGKIVISNNTDNSTGVSVVSMSGYTSTVSVGNIIAICGSNNRKDLVSAPSTNLCSVGTPSSVTYNTGAGMYSWTCGGTENCYAFNSSFTVLSIHGDGTNSSTTFIDSETTPKTITANGNSKISTNQNIFGGSSMYFDGTSNTYLSIPDSSDWDFPGIFSIDAWVMYPQDSMSGVYIVGSNPYSTSTPGIVLPTWLFAIRSNLAAFGYYTANGVYPIAMDIPYTFNADTWYHIAISRDASNDMRMFVNGSQIGSTLNNSTSITSTLSYIGIGGIPNGSYAIYTKGYIDELRISKGVAHWTSNFIPPNVHY